MGSSASDYYDRLEEQKIERKKETNKAWLSEYCRTIICFDPLGEEFEELKWMVENKDKIINNKRLISLLGKY